MPALRPMLAAVTVAALTSTVTACSLAASGEGVVEVNIGYQSKTINTVTAGTLLREQRYLEQRLEEIGRGNGQTYKVTWQDYDTGAPITTQMVAEKLDIGSMGDFPMLINGFKTKDFPNSRTELVGITGYNLKGALNMIVAPNASTARSLADLKGKNVSTSVGSAAHGLLVRALQQNGLKPEDVTVLNQQPSVGASALQSGGAAALSQFVAWPGLLVFRNEAKPLFDGASVNFPTMHGIVVRQAYTKQHPEVVQAFLSSVVEATRFLHEKPLDAARIVARISGLPPEVVYLYNGPNGQVTFDPTIKKPLLDALREDIPFLSSIGVLGQLDLNGFVNDDYLEQAYGSSYPQDAGKVDNPARIIGADAVCAMAVTDPATAGEVWFDGEQGTAPAANPSCLLKAIAAGEANGKRLRAGYVPAADTGTRWFAEKSVWVRDAVAPADQRFKPFTTRSGADAYVQGHPGASVIEFRDAVAAARAA